VSGQKKRMTSLVRERLSKGGEEQRENCKSVKEIREKKMVTYYI